MVLSSLAVMYSIHSRETGNENQEHHCVSSVISLEISFSSWTQLLFVLKYSKLSMSNTYVTKQGPHMKDGSLNYAQGYWQSQHKFWQLKHSFSSCFQHWSDLNYSTAIRHKRSHLTAVLHQINFTFTSFWTAITYKRPGPQRCHFKWPVWAHKPNRMQ